jgi:hypothetical protein
VRWTRHDCRGVLVATVIYDSVVLYVSDALILLMLAGGISLVIARGARKYAITFSLDVRQLRAILWIELGVLLVALCGFKFVVLSGGPGIVVSKILSAGLVTRTFSAVAIGVAFVLCVVGAWRWVKLVRALVVRHW